MHKKNFNEWNEKKKEIHNNISKKDILDKKVYFKDREVWWVSIGINIGFEIDGKNHDFERPVLIIKKINKNQFWGLPLTSKDKEGFFYLKASFSDDKKTTPIIMSQLKMFSDKRLLRKLGTIKNSDFNNIKKTISNFLLQ